MKPEAAAASALEYVLEGRRGESLLIICDEEKREIGQAFAKGAMELGLWTRLEILKAPDEGYRTEVPTHIIEMINSPNQPDIFINILRGPAKETPFRIKVIKLETRKGRSRLGHCPGITMDMLTEGALALTREEHETMQGTARGILALLQNVVEVHVESPSGSDFTLGVKGRTWFSDTYINWKDMKWMNLPTGEIIVGPVETEMNGKLVCDLAIGGIGPLKKPVEVEVEAGKVVKVSSDDAEALRIVEKAQATDEMAKHVGEFALGLNPKARIVEEFLESEKVGNTIHVAFGNNLDYPGTTANNSANHQDFLVNKPTVKVRYSDGRELVLMDKGEIKV